MRISASLITSLILSLSTVAAVGCATSGLDDGYSDIDGEASRPGSLDFWTAPDGQWHFHLKSGNGGILLTSEAYTGRTGAINGALSVLENGVDPAQYELKQTKTGYVVHLYAKNHESISFSEVYSTKSNATRAVKSCVRAITTYLDKREAQTTGARVEIQQGASGQFHFNFFAKNGQVVASSEAYTTEAAAYNGAFSVKANGIDAKAYTILENDKGGFYFTITSLDNGQVIAVSQQYTTKQSAQDGAAAVQNVLPLITVL